MLRRQGNQARLLLGQSVDPSGDDIYESVPAARARPGDGEPVGDRRVAEAEVLAQRVLRAATVAEDDLAQLPQAARLDDDPSSDGVAVGAQRVVAYGAGEFDGQPVARRADPVLEQRVAAGRGGDGDVEDAAVAEVGDRRAAAVEQRPLRSP